MTTFKLLWLTPVAFGMLPYGAKAEPIKVRQTVSKAGVESDVGSPRIVVDGQGSDRYDRVVTTQVDAWLTVSADRPTGGAGTKDGFVRIEGGQASIVKPAEPKIYKIDFPYRAPKSATVENMRVSPVELCNDRLSKLTGAARTKFLKEGDLFYYPNAWTATASVVWIILDTKGAFKDPPAYKTYSDSTPVGTSIECRALDRPKVRTTKSTSSGGARSPRAKKMDPTIQSATLRIEPAKIERIGGDLCPTELRLYGQVVTIRPFRGSAIILGQAYLSPITSLNFPSPGARSVRATYPMKWGGGSPGSLSSGGAAAAPRSQTVSLRMNVANDAKKVIETASETITVTCKRAQPKRVGSPDPQRVAPAPQRVTFQPPPAVSANPHSADFDVRIRRIDREGPGGAVQLWVYNAGPDSAQGCMIAARNDSESGFEEVAAVASVGPRETVKLSDPLPANAGEFRVACPGEPESATANNSVARWNFENAWPMKTE